MHRATDLRLQREVAVKVVRAQSNDAEARARFVREAQRTAQVRHPNVVEVFDVGETPEGELFLVMELLRGVPLSKRLSRMGRVDLATFGSIAPEICAALGAAHSLGIVHRDVKPANVMLVDHGSRQDFVKVVDFGIAKAESSATALTDTESFVGTLEYISPEQLLGDPPLGAYSDVYSLGVMFYLLLTGTPVFRGVPPAGLVHHHLEVVPESLRLRAPAAGISESLEGVVLRCLAKDPVERYANANQLGLAIEEALAPSGVLDDSWSRRLQGRSFSPLPRSSGDLSRVVPGLESEHALELVAEPPAQETMRLPMPVVPVVAPVAGSGFDLVDSPRTALMAKSPLESCTRCGGPVSRAAGACPACGEVRVSIAPPGIARSEPPAALPASWDEGSSVSSRRVARASREGPSRSGVSLVWLFTILAVACAVGAVTLVLVDADFGLVAAQVVAFFVVAAIGGYLWVKQA